MIETFPSRVNGALKTEVLYLLGCNLPMHVFEFRGLGLFIGIDLVKDPTTREPNPELATAIHQR